MAATVVGLFDAREDAQQAVQDLLDAGIARTAISLVAADPEGRIHSSHVEANGTLAAEGAASGATSGAVVGGIFGLLVGAGFLGFPAIGLIAIGPLAGLLTGVGIGAVSGGIIGTLIGMGIPDEHAHAYVEGVRRGGTLVTVDANEANLRLIEDILDRDGAVDIDDRAATYRAEGFNGYDPEAKAYSEEQARAERERMATLKALPASTDSDNAAPTTPDISTRSVSGGRIRTYSTPSGRAYADSPERE